jgi:hypothetical protein
VTATGTTSGDPHKLDKTGGTVTGSLTVGDGVASEAVTVVSSFTGGENNSDSTGRIDLYSYQRAQKNAADGITPASFGEVLRIYSRRYDSKQMIAWYGPTSYNPDHTPATADTVWFWMGAHYEANDHNSVHGHWSVEVPDSAGQMQTRMELRIWDPVTGVFGMDRTILKVNAADVVIACDAGSLQIAGTAGTAKNIYFTDDSLAATAGKRWGLQADTTAEGGSNVGTDFRINRYNDSGAFVDSPVFVKRSTGVVGIGNITSPAARVDVSEAGSRHTIEAIQTTSGTVNFAAYSGILGAVANRYVDFRISGDSTGRFVLLGDGKQEWGTGGAGGRDTNLYRAAAGVLQTDGKIAAGLDIEVTTNTKGFVLHDRSDGHVYRLKATAGVLGLEQVS